MTTREAEQAHRATGDSCPTHPHEGGTCEPMEGEPWRCVYGEHPISYRGLTEALKAKDAEIARLKVDLREARDLYRLEFEGKPRAVALEREIAMLRADNAALMKVGRFFEGALADVVENGSAADLGWMDQGKADELLAIVRAAHPGAALLEEMKRDKEVIKILGHHLSAVARKLRAKDLGPDYATITIRHERTDLAFIENALKVAGVLS